MNDGTYKCIKDVEIGDQLAGNNRVLAKITGNPQYLSWYMYNNDLVSSNVIDYHQNTVIRNNRSALITFYPIKHEDCYSIITENNTIDTQFNTFRDFEITRDSAIQEYITRTINDDGDDADSDD